MADNPKEVSCYSSSLLIEYAIRKGIPEDSLFIGIAQNYRPVLKNPLEWIDANIWSKLANNYEKICSNDLNALFNAGKDITENQIPNFQLFLLRIASLKLLMKNAKIHIEKNINKNLITEASFNKEYELIASFTPKNKIGYSTQICDFNRGSTYATILLKGFKNVKIEETQCAARSSADSCIYKLTWDPNRRFVIKLKNFLLFRFSNQNAIISHMELLLTAATSTHFATSLFQPTASLTVLIYNYGTFCIRYSGKLKLGEQL